MRSDCRVEDRGYLCPLGHWLQLAHKAKWILEKADDGQPEFFALRV
jgi:hypothetical protein